MKICIVCALLLAAMVGCSPSPTATPLPITPTRDSTATSLPATPTQPPTPTPTQRTVTIARPFPQHVTYAPGTVLPNHRTQEQLDDDVRAFYDEWKAAYLVSMGTTADGFMLYRVALGREGALYESTVSEGQGYGMLIVPLMAGYDSDAQSIFDGLWEFARAHPSELDSRLMDWSVPDTTSGDYSAFDGDADMALGLLLADAQWGSQGRIHYREEAETLIGGILESTIGPQSRLPTLGDWVEVAGEPHNQYTPRSSDFMLVNFRAYGKATDEPAWNDVVAQSQAVILAMQSGYSPQAGLIPDFIVMPGEDHTPQPAPPDFLEGPHDGDYYYNAGRVPWRVGTDALLNDDATSRVILRKISTWIESAANGDPANIKSGYRLDGTPLPDGDYFTTFFASPMGVAAMNNPEQQEWLNAVYDSVYDRHEEYYEDSVTLLCLLTMTGNFWVP